MKLTTRRENLLWALSAAMPVIKKTPMPILANMLLEAQGDELRITATDLDTQMRCVADVQSEVMGSITVPARKLLDIVRLAPDGATIKLTEDGDKLRAQAGPSRYTLATLPAINYPAFDQGNVKQEVQIPADVLLRALRKVAFCAASSDVRFYLNGVAIRLLADSLETVASDGHRLAVMRTPLPVSPDNPATHEDKPRIIPRDAVTVIMKLLSGEGPVKLQLGANTVSIVTQAFQFSAKLIEGVYPNVERVIPAKSDARMMVDKSGLMAAIARANVVTETKDGSIRLVIEPEGMTVESANDGDDAAETLPVELSGNPITLGFNGRYLSEALNSIEAEKAEFGLSDKAVLVTDPDEAGWLSVVMPMRL